MDVKNDKPNKNCFAYILIYWTESENLKVTDVCQKLPGGEEVKQKADRYNWPQ